MAKPKVLIVNPTPNQLEGLKQLNVSYITKKALVDFRKIEARHTKNAVKKAAVITAQKTAADSEGLVLAAFSRAVYYGVEMGVPKFKMDVAEWLNKISGGTHSIYTGWAIVNPKTQQHYSGLSSTRVTFRELKKHEAEKYANKHNVVKWSAGYNPLMSEAISFISKVDGSYSGFAFGLPFEDLIPIFREEKII